MRLKTLMLLLVIASLAVAAPLAAAEQQESYTFTLGLLGGIGRALDAGPVTGLSTRCWASPAGLRSTTRTA